MTRDRVELGLLVVAFAALLTAHLSLTVGLARRTPRWRAAIALLAAPLAPWWGWQEKMRVRAVIWIAAAILYVVMMGLANAT